MRRRSFSAPSGDVHSLRLRWSCEPAQRAGKVIQVNGLVHKRGEAPSDWIEFFRRPPGDRNHGRAIAPRTFSDLADELGATPRVRHVGRDRIDALPAEVGERLLRGSHRGDLGAAVVQVRFKHVESVLVVFDHEH